ncbi:MAG: DUF504 domain-containing protein, partial [Betaproteobacteria bacterium]
RGTDQEGSRMQPIHELLNRIKWDQDFGQGDFTVGYYDRILDRIVTVPMRALHFDPDDRFRFQVVDAAGEIHAVPYHRVRVVCKNGRPIWQRKR